MQYSAVQCGPRVSSLHGEISLHVFSQRRPASHTVRRERWVCWDTRTTKEASLGNLQAHAIDTCSVILFLNTPRPGRRSLDAGSWFVNLIPFVLGPRTHIAISIQRFFIPCMSPARTTLQHISRSKPRLLTTLPHSPLPHTPAHASKGTYLPKRQHYGRCDPNCQRVYRVRSRCYVCHYAFDVCVAQNK